MKRYVGISASVAALGLLAYLGNVMLVQGQPGSSGGTKVATVNMYVVMKNFKKVEQFKNEMQALAEPLEKKMKELDNAYKKWAEYSKSPTIKPEEQNKAAKIMVDLKRQMEDIRNEAQQVIMKRGQEQIVQVYREIEDAVKRYAAANGIHVVLNYLEPDGQQYTAANIDRKLNGCGNAGACGPIYIAPGVDISQQVVNVLNSANSAASGN